MGLTTTAWLPASASGPWTTCLVERRLWPPWLCSSPFTGGGLWKSGSGCCCMCRLACLCVYVCGGGRGLNSNQKYLWLDCFFYLYSAILHSLVMCDCQWVTVGLHSTSGCSLKWCTYSTIWLQNGWCPLKLLTSRYTVCTHHTVTYQFTEVFEVTYIHSSGLLVHAALYSDIDYCTFYVQMWCFCMSTHGGPCFAVVSSFHELWC